MTRTGYAWGMSNTPSDPDYINTKALEGFVRAFDRVMTAKLGLDAPEMPRPEEFLRAARERLKQQEHARRLSIWHTFPPLRAIIRFRDNIRLRRYNREWIKNNIH